MIENGKKVYVGLSGGVDSSVSALLLKQAGYHVTGVFIKAWYPDFIDCDWRNEMRDAMRVCAKLNINFKICDLEEEYKKRVVNYLIEEYQKGRTPNPDVMCNKYIKFDGFLKFALDQGADYVATGHYAKVSFKNDKFHLENAIDQQKDQTYFLWTLNQEKLSKILFPIGHLKKDQVRKIARKNNLFTAEKKDSQGLCFLGHVDIENFLSNFLQTKPGDVLNLQGEKIGRHKGSIFYTIGQRHGFEIQEDIINRSKYYVVSKNISQNTITVSDQENFKKHNQSKKFLIEQLNIINDLSSELYCLYRYNGKMVKIICHQKGEETAEITFMEKVEPLASGQSIVFYSKQECLGGGILS